MAASAAPSLEALSVPVAVAARQRGYERRTAARPHQREVRLRPAVGHDQPGAAQVRVGREDRHALASAQARQPEAESDLAARPDARPGDGYAPWLPAAALPEQAQLDGG